MTKGKSQIIIPILAMIFLLVGTISSAYVYSNQLAESDVDIVVNNMSYSMDQIINNLEIDSINIDNIEVSGIPLDDLIIYTGVTCLSCYSYTITGSDGYQKTVNSENIENGILSVDKSVYFSDLPKAFRVKNVVSIELVNK